MGSRPEGHICELRCPPNCKNVHGFIEIPTILEKLFFHEFVSGIPKRELINYHLGAKVQFSVDKREKGFYAKDLYVKPPETKQVQCLCGWEDAVGKGIQEGFVGVLKTRFGFITKEFPREPNPKGIYFHELELKDHSIAQLNIGDRVHFVVKQNDKGCIAQQIDVLKGGFPPTTTAIDPHISQGGFPPTTTSIDPHIYGTAHQMFLGPHTTLGQFSQLRFSPPVSTATVSPLRGPSPSVSPPTLLRVPTPPVFPPRGPPMRNSIPGACSSFHEEYDGTWQCVRKGKR